MEKSKMHYENSTRKLVNILESLSSQLTGPCVTRHCPDTDSFDSVLSRSVMTLIFDTMNHFTQEKQRAVESAEGDDLHLEPGDEGGGRDQSLLREPLLRLLPGGRE